MLELNAYTPLIGHALLDSLKVLIACNQSMALHMMTNLKVNTQTAYEKLLRSPSLTTALLPHIGYHKASKLARIMKKDNINIINANKKMGCLEEKKINNLLKAEYLLKEGFSVKDLGEL
jgi:aspartate ammonia-lyase